MAEYEDGDVRYENRGGYGVQSSEQAITEFESSVKPTKPIAFPKAKIPISAEHEKDLIIWLDNWLIACENSQQPKITEWSEQEKDYRAKSLGPQQTPFVGACGDVVPAIAMAVDPIHARLDTGVFKADPVIVLKPLRKSITKYIHALELWIQYYLEHRVRLREKASPRLLEMCKHGTTVFKTIYDRDTVYIKSYDKDFNIVKKEVTRFSGPNTFGISINDFLFPPYYQRIQDCPVVFERQRVAYSDLKIAEQQGKLVDCDKVKNQETNERTQLEEERATSANHKDPLFKQNTMIEVFECHFRYDCDGDGVPENLIATYHEDTHTLLQLRYNWYFHQKYPYTVIPYTITNDSVYGLGLCEMSKPFQDMLTKWHRMAQDNAYLANTVMFIAKKDSGIEGNVKVFAGKTFYVDDPSKDLKPFRAGDTYNSSLEERQNLFGLLEKRTGISDYLTGRESEIIGSRATATSTLALIQEGTRRVEEVLENIRTGISEIVEMWVSIWLQYGLDGLDDIVFADDEVVADLKDFFDNMKIENIHGALAIDLSASDAANNRQVQQQLQLSIVQLMMNYLEKLLAVGAQAIQAQQTMPEYVEMVKEVMHAARSMFRDLLTKYEVRNPEEYLPDLEAILNGQPAPSGGPGIAGGAPPVAPSAPQGSYLPPVAPATQGLPGVSGLNATQQLLNGRAVPGAG